MVDDRDKSYFRRCWIALDQFINVLIFNGVPDETISSRVGKLARKGHKPSICLCRILDIFDKDHCKKSIEKDEGMTL